jgi:hypothetical protein
MSKLTVHGSRLNMAWHLLLEGLEVLSMFSGKCLLVLSVFVPCSLPLMLGSQLTVSEQIHLIGILVVCAPGVQRLEVTLA